MKKAMQIKLTDDTGNIYRWTIHRVPRAINCLGASGIRVISGWEYTDHEGYARFSEGNWGDLVSSFRMTAGNYGLTPMTNIS